MKTINEISWMKDGWEDYLYWQSHDKKMLKKINQLIKDTIRNPFSGIGKPEPLRFGFEGFWSKRISSEHRLVYKVESGTLLIIQCRYHYSK